MPGNLQVLRLTVAPRAPKFLGMKQFGSAFDFHEEFCQSKGFSPEKSRLLMRLDTGKLDMTKPEVQAADAPYALTWAKMYGKGRVFYSAFGHAPSTWDDPRIQEMYLDAIKWSMDLIDGDATPVPLTVSPTGK